MTDPEIIEKLGGTVAVGAALNLNHQTVSNWKTRGISEAGRYKIRDLAIAKGVRLPKDFISRKPSTQER